MQAGDPFPQREGPPFKHCALPAEEQAAPEGAINSTCALVKREANGRTRRFVSGSWGRLLAPTETRGFRAYPADLRAGFITSALRAVVCASDLTSLFRPHPLPGCRRCASKGPGGWGAVGSPRLAQSANPERTAVSPQRGAALRSCPCSAASATPETHLLM